MMKSRYRNIAVAVAAAWFGLALTSVQAREAAQLPGRQRSCLIVRPVSRPRRQRRIRPDSMKAPLHRVRRVLRRRTRSMALSCRCRGSIGSESATCA